LDGKAFWCGERREATLSKRIKAFQSTLVTWLGRQQVRQVIVLLVVVAGFAFSIVYTDVWTYDPVLTPASGYSDSVDYLNMYFGEPGTGLRAYRPLVPFLARLLPDLPYSLFNSGRSFDRFAVAALKFGVVNLFFLIGACVALYALQRGFGLSYLQAFLGVLLFLAAQTIVRSAGLPMTDAAFFFFFALCLIAIQWDNVWLLLFAHTVGILAKELVVLCIPLILLSLLPRRRKAWMLLATVPGIALYVLVRFKYAPSPLDGYVTGQVLSYFDDQLLALTRPNGLVNLFLAFGLAWIPAVYALAACRVPRLLRRWSWLVAIVFVGVLLGAGNLGRTTFTAFPVVMPLAALGLSSWLGQAAESPAGTGEWS
jgi:hypothetical protein